ncbi:MAG: hypothetical protein J7K01_04300, partial [Thermovirga sp.]|nr:hypothetical protein [Thermovirga sp.]
MKKFIVEDPFWQIFPDAKIGVVICHGIDNSVGNRERYQKLLLDAENEALKYLKNPTFSEN